MRESIQFIPSQIIFTVGEDITIHFVGAQGPSHRIRVDGVEEENSARISLERHSRSFASRRNESDFLELRRKAQQHLLRFDPLMKAESSGFGCI